jgi:hypothetical protein
MYQNGTAASGGALAATGVAFMQYAAIAVALFTIGFAMMALSKFIPRSRR